jgi:integrase
MINQKNKALPSIPIGGRLNELLKKYNFHSPKTYSNRVNSNIKDACEMVGISEPIEVLKKKGGKVIIDFYKKNELVHVHTARRTAATNMYKSELPMLLIMKITGHKKESSLLKYIVLDNDSTKEVLKGNSFFK